MKDDLAVVILAAGMGTRMHSKTQKILHQVGGLPMIEHVVRAAEAVSAQTPLLVIGPLGGERVRALFGARARYVVQAEQLGTGHATQVAAPLLQTNARQVLVTYGDMPLLKAETLAALAERQAEKGSALAMLSLLGDPASSFGRVVRDGQGRVLEIVEMAEAKRRPNTAELLATREQNAGVYCFDAAWLWAELPQLPPRQARSGTEYYLTDLIEVAVKQGRGVEALITDEPDEALGAGTRAELIPVDRAFRKRVNERWLEAGVTIIDPGATYIDPDVTIGQDTVIWPNSYLQGSTIIGEDCIIGPNVILRDCQIGPGQQIEQQRLENRQRP